MQKSRQNKAGRIAPWIKRWTTGWNLLGSILASTTKGAQHERLAVSPCEIIMICWSFFIITSRYLRQTRASFFIFMQKLGRVTGNPAANSFSFDSYVRAKSVLCVSVKSPKTTCRTRCLQDCKGDYSTIHHTLWSPLLTGNGGKLLSHLHETTLTDRTKYPLFSYAFLTLLFRTSLSLSLFRINPFPADVANKRYLGSAPKSHFCDLTGKTEVIRLSDLMALFIDLGCLYCKQAQRAFNVFKNTLNWLEIDSVDQMLFKIQLTRV
jgi:hypothetical protein